MGEVEKGCYQMPSYIYCVIEDKEPKVFISPAIGERGDELRTICYNSLAAVVSNTPAEEYAVSRENTLAHEKVIEEAMKEHAVLPVRFNTIAQNEGKIKGILEKEHDRFKKLLSYIEDKKEMGLKAMLKEEFVYADILEKYEDIKKAKEKIIGRPPEQTHYQRLDIGRMVEEALVKEREAYKQEILDVLSPGTEDVKINNVYGERMIVNAAFLIKKDKEAEFDQKVQELGKKYDSKIKFKYIGTIPPFNFINLVIKTDEY